MCQPKPGPRCSAHARTTLETRAATKAAAEQARNDARAALRNPGPRTPETTDPAEKERLRQVAVAADKAYWQAERAHAKAARDFDTTPAGMRALRDKIARLRSEGDDHGAAETERRLDDAQSMRATQVADLAMARRHRARLAEPTPEELAALDQSEAAVSTHGAALTAAADTYTEATAQWQRLVAECGELERADVAAFNALREAVAASITARAAVEAEAKRLYVEAGVVPRFAGFYASDMSTAASAPARSRYSRSSYRDPFAEDDGPLREMSMKVKRDGPDRDKTLAAKAAAETDEGFRAANARMMSTIAAVSEAKQSAARLRRDHAPSYDARQQARTVATTAKYAVEDAKAEHETTVKRHEALRARIGSGLGVGPVETVAMSQVKDEIVRNPDGTTNAYVYNEPSYGFPHGRYVAATGITTVHGMGAANALVLENGTKAWQHGHYSRTLRGAGETTSGYRHVVLVPAQEGAKPLRDEGVVTAGFYTFIDSTD